MTSVLLHRDLHPLNVLWTNDRVTGVVDWVNACVGHPHADLGHCRWNLSVLVDAAAADALLSRYLSVHPGQVYNRWWDLAAAMSFLPGPIGTSGWLAVGRSDLTQSGVVESTELFVKDALENL